MSPRHHCKKNRSWLFFKRAFQLPNSGGSRGEPRGARAPSPLFLDQTEARRTEKIFLGDLAPHLSKGLDDRGPPLSQGLDQALPNDDIRQYVDDINPSERSCDVYMVK